MFQVGDRVRLREDVTADILDIWASSSDLKHREVYTIKNINDKESTCSQGTINIEGSLCVYPPQFFEKVERAILENCEGKTLATTINRYVLTFLDCTYVYEVWQEDKIVTIDYVTKVSDERIDGEYTVQIPDHIQGRGRTLEYAFDSFILFIAKQF